MLETSANGAGAAEAKATDEAEDQLYGQARGDELPEQLCTPEGRREFFRQAKQKRQRQGTDAHAPEGEAPAPADGEFEFDAERIVARVQGREGWLRDARRQLEALHAARGAGREGERDRSRQQAHQGQRGAALLKGLSGLVGLTVNPL